MITEAEAYAWAGVSLRPIANDVEAHRLQQVLDKVASAIFEASRLTTVSTVTAAPVELAESHVDDGAAAGEPNC